MLPAKKAIIASRLHLTHEHFSRILHELAAAELIVVEGRMVPRSRRAPPGFTAQRLTL